MAVDQDRVSQLAHGIAGMTDRLRVARKQGDWGRVRYYKENIGKAYRLLQFIKRSRP